MGSVRTGLFAYLFARQNNGKFILRIEDTDKERSKKEFDEAILDSMKWLNLEYDELYRQSERTEIYKKYLTKLVTDGNAYISKEENPEEGKPASAKSSGEARRTEVIRFKNPNKKVKFTDLIRGEIEFDTTELGDFVIAKNMAEPLFHLTVVVDDFEMGVTHVIRGEDHISNTPRHILIQEAIGAPRPFYAHLPLVLWEDKSKLSKRKHGEKVSLSYYRSLGYLPEAILNFLAMIGWNPGGDKEIFSMEELVKLFDFKKIQKSGAVFNVKKLDWINQNYIRLMIKDLRLNKVKEELQKAGIENADEKILGKIDSVATERISRFGEIKEMADRGEFGYFFKAPEFPKEKLLWKGETDFSKAKKHLENVLEKISAIPEKIWNKDSVKTSVWDYAEKEGRGNVLWPMRYSLSGMEKSPDPFTLAELLGKEESIARIQAAIKL
jgi:glutamyl-tRNA synthetase